MLLKSSIDFTRLRINIVGQFTTVFLLTVALLPAVSLYWDSTLFGVQTNWLIYPLLLLSATVLVIARRSASDTGVYLIGAGILYGLLCMAFGGDIQKLIRIVFSLLPVAFIRYAARIDLRQFKWFMGIYVALMLIPVYNCYLQLKGELPYYTFDTIDGVHLGRLSGGYNKPTGLIVFLFPIYLYGFYLWLEKGKTLTGHFVVALIFSFVFYINHRTSTVAFGIIWLLSYVRTPVSRWLTFYYRYYLHFISGVLGFLLVYVMYTQVGIFKAFRGRMPMWMNHSRHYWEGSPAEILIGKLRVLLPASWDPRHELWSLDEVHQNTFSLLVFGGLLGYFLYCMFMRATYFFVHNRLRYGRLQYIASACFLFFTIFGLTNEHIYYPTIVWPIFVWLFLVVGISTSHVESVTSQAS